MIKSLLNSPATRAPSQLQSIRSRQTAPVSFMVGHDLAASMDQTTAINGLFNVFKCL